MIMLDTHVLVWWFLAPDELSATAQKHCRNLSRINGLISSISLWEIALKVKNGRWELGITVRDFLERIKSTGLIRIVPVDENIWLENVALDWDHRDPADRTIVATAIHHDIPLITKDPVISEFYDKVVW